MKNIERFLEPREVYHEGRPVLVSLVPLSIGETIEGKRELFIAQGYGVADLGLIEAFVREEPSVEELDFLVIADAASGPIVPEGNPSLCFVPVHGVCKGCSGRSFRNGLIDYRVQKRRYEDDPTVISLLVILP